MGLLDLFRSHDDDAPPRGDADRIGEVEVVLDDLRPMLAMDGGHVRLVAVEEDGRVLIALGGACSGCHAQGSTLFEVIEPRLAAALPWLTAVESL